MTDDAIFEALDTLIATFDTGKREPLVPKEPVSGGRDLRETTQAEKSKAISPQSNSAGPRADDLSPIEPVPTVPDRTPLVSNSADIARSRREMHWHIEHGERVPRERCAGCRNTIAAREAVLELADGNRTHLADDYACLIAWGERWRRGARQACSSAELDAPRPSRTGEVPHAG